MPRGVGVRVPLSALSQDEQRKLFVFFCVRTKCHAPPVAPRTTCLCWVVMCIVATQQCGWCDSICSSKLAISYHTTPTIYDCPHITPLLGHLSASADVRVPCSAILKVVIYLFVCRWQYTHNYQILLDYYLG